jgi:hypothetical protein
MMKKNYFGKFFAIATVFAGLSLTSCDKNDNAIINGQVWKPSSAQLVDGGAVVSADSPSEISRMIGRLRQDIIKAAENKETFTITIDATAINATKTDNTISFLTINNGDLVVNFSGNITTEEPLVLQSKGVDENQGSYGTAIAKVAFNFPAGTSGIDLNVDMPKASVTVKPVSGNLGIDELLTKTAMTTLTLESGVTVNWLQLKGGNVVIKNGAQINGLESTYLDIYPNGITSKGGSSYWDEDKQDWVYTETPYLIKDSLRKTTSYTEKDFYYVQNGKLLAQENGDYSIFNLNGNEEKASADPIEIIIPDGVKAWTWQSWNGDYDKINWPTINVTGEGDATFMYNGWKDSDGKVSLWTSGISLYRINKLSNVAVDFTHALVWNSDDNKYEVLEVDTASNNYKWSQITLPVNSENCTFNAKRFYMANNLADGIVSSTHKNSIFNSLKSDQNCTFEAYFPAQNDKRKSFTLAFDTCEFDQAKFGSGFNGDWETTKDYKGYISFANSKIGGKAVSKTTDMIAWAWSWTDGETVKAETLYTIDGVNYKPIEKDNKWYLLEVE